MDIILAEVSILEQSILGIILAILLGGFGWTWRTYVPKLIEAHTTFLSVTAEATAKAAQAMAEAAERIAEVNKKIGENHERIHVIVECFILLIERLAEKPDQVKQVNDLIIRLQALRLKESDWKRNQAEAKL
jgi:hypothetical protein